MSTLPASRLGSLDVLRGLVIVLMALDHIRDFFGAAPFAPEDMAQTTAPWFFTRWVTHFCAPVFVFLAGTAAYLYGRKAGLPALRRFLWTRGLWLLAVEFLVINLSWMFDWWWNEGFMFGQVIWVISMSMFLLSAMLSVPLRWIAAFGLVLVLGHNLLDGVRPESLGSFAGLWNVLHIGWGWVPFSQSFGFLVVYPLIPWVGVMMLGYAFGTVMLWEPARRQRWLLRAGLVTVLFFIALRATNWYGDGAHWAPQERGAVYSLLSFLNTSKYPPSLLFLCMTIGPGLLLLALFERLQNPATRFLEVFGRVPFFFYIIHFSLIHTASRLYFWVTKGWWIDFFSTRPEQWPTGYAPSLGLVYLVWALFIPTMYLLCRWYGRYKFSHTHWWLKYI